MRRGPARRLQRAGGTGRLKLLADEIGPSHACIQKISDEDRSSTARRDAAQALAGKDVVHSQGRRRIRRAHGRRARALRGAARSARRPVVCRFDETPRQLIGGVTKTPTLAEPGEARPLRLRVRTQRHRQRLHVRRRQPPLATRQGEAEASVPASTSRSACASLSTCTIPEADKIRVVLDNLSAHSAAALYQRFVPADARRILNRLEFHFTPKHASWLNMVEIEIGVMVNQCLDRRIADKVNSPPRSPPGSGVATPRRRASSGCSLSNARERNSPVHTRCPQPTRFGAAA